MARTIVDMERLVEQMPDAYAPGQESKFAGPPPERAREIVTQILEGGREALLKLIGMIRDAAGGGEKNYKPGYTLNCIALTLCASGKEDQRRRRNDETRHHDRSTRPPAHPPRARRADCSAHPISFSGRP